MIPLLGAWAGDVFDDGEVNPYSGSSSPGHSALPFLIWVLVLMLVSLALPLAVATVGFRIKLRKAGQARTIALRAWAQERDYSYRAEEPDLARLYPGLPLESGGQGRLYENVIRGRLCGRPFTAFEYYRSTSSSTSAAGRTTTLSVPHRLQVVAIEGPAGWPDLRVSRQGHGSEPAITFGRRDVQLGNSRFDSAYRVRAHDEDAARRMLVPLAPALLARTDQEFWVDGRTMLALRPGKLEATDLETWLGQLKAVLRASGAAG